MVKVRQIQTLYKLPKIKISYKISSSELYNEIPKILSPKCAFNLVRHCFDHDTFDLQEEIILVCLNSRNIPIGFYSLSSGGTKCAILDPKILLMIALGVGSNSIIIAHNHPSGSKNPSKADHEITKRIATICSSIGMPLLDHLIITKFDFFSFVKETNLIPSHYENELYIY
jgi:DNA repair protein RadC